MTDIHDFLKLAQFSDDGSTRLIIDSDSNKPCTAGLVKKGSKSKGIGVGEYYAENALFIDRLENAVMAKIIDRHIPAENGRTGLNFLSRYHQGASAFLQRDMLNLVLILKADAVMLDKFKTLQGLADRFCGDDRFITLIKSAFPGIKRSAWQDITQHKLQILNSKTGMIIPPYGLLTKCCDICTMTDQLVAAKHILNLAKANLFQAPLVELLAEILYESSWGMLNAKGLDITLSTIAMALGPKAAGVPGLALASASGQAFMSHCGVSLGVAHLDLGVSRASRMASKAVKSLLTSTASSKMPLPVFAIRRDRTGPEEKRPYSGRNVVYTLYDRNVIIALISYLALPMADGFLKRYANMQGRHLSSAEQLLNNEYAKEEARLIFKNLLGSPNWEDSLVQTPRGMAPEEYVFYKFKVRGNNPWNEPERLWPGVINRLSDDNLLRPPSFVRLLAVAAGITNEHEDGSTYPHGKGFWSQMATKEPSTPMWLHPQEEKFDTLPGANMLKDEYLAPPWMHCSNKIKTALPAMNCKVDIVEAPPLEKLMEAIKEKQRWICDWESPKCSICGTTLFMFNRHHCRDCGKMMCRSHSCETPMYDKETNARKAHKVCHKCRRAHNNSAELALREGDVHTPFTN